MEVGHWVAERLSIALHPPFVAIGLASDAGEAKGGFVYNCYNHTNIEISYYGPGTLSRSVIRAAFWAYPFEQLGVLRLTASTKRSNKLVRKLLPRLGFEFEAVLKNYYGPTRNDDAMVFRLDRKAAERWKRG